MKPEAALTLRDPMRVATALSAAVMLTLVGLVAPTSLAQTQLSPASLTATDNGLNKGAPARPASVKPGAESKPALITKPIWTALTPAQHKALKPLAAQWDQLGVESKRKWLVISKNYDSLPSAEQTKMHARMSAWVSLSTTERTEARLNFAEAQKLPADEKAAHWQSYQGLSAEEKRKLAAQAPGKPAGVAVVKPTSPNKLAEVPVTPHAPQQGAKLAGANQAVNPNTLLPQRPAATEASLTSK